MKKRKNQQPTIVTQQPPASMKVQFNDPATKKPSFDNTERKLLNQFTERRRYSFDDNGGSYRGL